MLRPLPIKNIVFDLGGVILDLDSSEAMRRFRTLGLENPEDYLGPYGQKGIFLDFETGRLSIEQLAEAFARLTGRSCTRQQMIWAWMGFISGLDTAKLNHLERLAETYSIYLLSNTNPAIMIWADSKDLSPAGRPLSSYFRKMYLSYRMGLAKPGEDIFRVMAADAGFKPEETLFVDDGAANVATASRLGSHTLQPVNGTDWMPALEKMLAREEQYV